MDADDIIDPKVYAIVFPLWIVFREDEADPQDFTLGKINTPQNLVGLLADIEPLGYTHVVFEPNDAGRGEAFSFAGIRESAAKKRQGRERTD